MFLHIDIITRVCQNTTEKGPVLHPVKVTDPFAVCDSRAGCTLFACSLPQNEKRLTLRIDQRKASSFHHRVPLQKAPRFQMLSNGLYQFTFIISAWAGKIGAAYFLWF